MKHLLLLFAGLIFVLAGCSKTKDPDPLTQSQVIARLWKMQQYDLIIDDKVGPTLYTRGSNSNLDDYSMSQFNFKTDGSFAQSDVDDKGKPVQETGTWKLTNADKTLELTFANKTVAALNVVALSATELTVNQKTALKDLDAATLAELKMLGVQPKINFGFQFVFRP